MRAIPLVLIVIAALAYVACRDREAAPNTFQTPSATAPPVEATSPATASTVPAATATPGDGVALMPRTHEHTLESGGRTRKYLVHIPPGGSSPMPLVMVLHGGGGNANQVMRSTRFDEVADEHGFIAVFPHGNGRLSDEFLLTWNSGNCCAYALAQGFDDVSFLRAVVSAVVAQYGADAGRVFVTGMSNGGMMSYRLACEASDIFLAAAPVAGALNLECSPDSPISLLAVHGTDDRSVLYEGGVPLQQADPTPREDASVAQSLGFFVGHNGCDERPQSSTEGILRFDEWHSCAAGTRVALYTIEGGVHEWPGDTRASVAPDIDASRLIWEFFGSLERR
jgi:polyhydroxybutyrate depolymerase